MIDGPAPPRYETLDGHEQAIRGVAATVTEAAANATATLAAASKALRDRELDDCRGDCCAGRAISDAWYELEVALRALRNLSRIAQLDAVRAGPAAPGR